MQVDSKITLHHSERINPELQNPSLHTQAYAANDKMTELTTLLHFLPIITDHKIYAPILLSSLVCFTVSTIMHEELLEPVSCIRRAKCQVF